MNAPRNNFRQSGFSMIEVLVTLIILLVGLLGLAGVMVQSQRSEMESYQRVQALILLQDMAGRINANRNVSSCYAFTNTLATGSPNFGASPTLPVLNPPACAIGTAAQKAQYAQDMTDWHNALLGAAETSGVNNVGAMIGARGCVSYSAGTEVLDMNGIAIPGSGIYTIAVAWQGLGDTFAPPVPVIAAAMNCGKNQYGAETKRRIVSLTLRTASLI